MNNLCCCQTDKSCRTAQHTMSHRFAGHRHHQKRRDYAQTYSILSASSCNLNCETEGAQETALPPFSVGFPGDALTASRASVATLAIFASRRAAKTLVGEPPQTRLWDSSAQTPLCCFGTKCPKIRPLRCASSPHKVLRLCGAPHAQSNLSASPFAIAPVPFCAGRP